MTLAEANEKRKPGSQAAREAGCTCSAIGNGHGTGGYWMGAWTYYVRLDCPLHVREKTREAASADV